MPPSEEPGQRHAGMGALFGHRRPRSNEEAAVRGQLNVQAKVLYEIVFLNRIASQTYALLGKSSFLIF